MIGQFCSIDRITWKRKLSRKLIHTRTTLKGIYIMGESSGESEQPTRHAGYLRVSRIKNRKLKSSEVKKELANSS